ncbi:MAG: hypothetical protein ACLQU1_38690 [Bryobacteraceae bacterium]
MQLGGQKPSLGVVFDCDMGAIGDALALAMLFGFQGKNESRVISVSITRASLPAAAFTEVLTRFYLGDPGPFGPGNLPIGVTEGGKLRDDPPMTAAVLSRQTAEGKPQYPSSIRKWNDTADPAALIRNAYTAQFDQNAITVLAGPATNLVATLALPGAKDLISRKSRYLVAALGTFPDGPPDPAAQADLAAAKALFTDWPGPIVAAGAEVGAALPFPGASIDKDFAWSPAHPLADAYRAVKPMPYDAVSSALAAVLYAVRPQETYFKLSEPGALSVLDDGRLRFTPSPDGKHKYLIADPAQKDRVTQAYTELASTKPVPRRSFRPTQKKQE